MFVIICLLCSCERSAGHGGRADLRDCQAQAGPRLGGPGRHPKRRQGQRQHGVRAGGVGQHPRGVVVVCSSDHK
eukprot:1362645-Pyramimonas_sp.AAC.1